MKNNKLLQNPFYQSLMRNMVLTVILVSITPTILVIILLLNQFQTSYQEKMEAHLKELVLKHKQNIDGFLKERLFKPLKMKDTDFWVGPEKATRLAQLYSQPKPGELKLGRVASQLTTKPTMFLGGQGLCSTAEDYERFCRMMLNRGELDGVRVLKAETVDLMFQNHLNGRPSGRMQRYGLGCAVDRKGSYTWSGANGTQFRIDRSNNVCGIFMVQTQGYRAPTYNAFRRLVNEAARVAGRGPSRAEIIGLSGNSCSPTAFVLEGAFTRAEAQATAGRNDRMLRMRQRCGAELRFLGCHTAPGSVPYPL